MNKETTKSSASQCADQLTSEDLRELAAKAGKDVTGALIIAFNKGVARGMKASDRKVVDVSELSLTYSEVDDSLILIGDLITEFFDQYDPNTDDGKCGILYEYARARAWATSLGHQIGSVKKQLVEMGATR